MRRQNLLLALALACVLAPAAWSHFKPVSTASEMTQAAKAFVSSLNDEQRKVALLAYGANERVDWHFIPKEYRKGLQIKEMSEPQRKLALTLLRSSLSELGYAKATRIMDLENVLNYLEMGKGKFLRDPQRYYFTLFGEPKPDGRWGLSVEGHHLSFNFVVEGEKIVSSTPQFFGANPATLAADYLDRFKKGGRVLAKEEQLAFKLLAALDEEQAKAAVIEAKAPSDIRAAGEAQPPQTPPAGVAAEKMNDSQRALLQSIVDEYLAEMPPEVGAERRAAIDKAGASKIHFAWAGAKEPGVGHYYRIEGPSFLIEFVNVQPDGAGNPANHIHCVWRDTSGDFGLPVAEK